MPVVTKEKFLCYWLALVAATSFFGTIQAFVGTEGLKIGSFTLRKNEVTPLTARIFSVWTLLATVVRFACALDIHNKSLYRTCIITFIVAIVFYLNEYLIMKTVALWPGALPPLLIASTSILFMIALRPQKPKAQ
jgi:hypothetical protein